MDSRLNFVYYTTLTMSSSPTFLLTGSRGFLGSHLAGELRRRHPDAELVLAHRRPAPGHVSCNLSAPVEVKKLLGRFKPSVVYHLAGTTKPLGWDALWDAHVRTTCVLLETVRRLPKPLRPRVVMAGSSAEYGRAAGRSPVSEDGATFPATPYGSTKLAQTLAALAYRGRGVDVIVARVFNAVGARIPDNLAPGAFARQIACIERGLQPPRLEVGNLESLRDFVDAGDVARAFADLAARKPFRPLYNVCSGRAVSVRQMLDRLIALARVDIRVRIDRARFQASDLPVMIGSHRRLTADASWRPDVSLDSSLRDTLDWYRALPD